MTPATLQDSRAIRHQRRSPIEFERYAWPLFALAAAVAAALILWFGRDLTYSADDLVQFMLAPDFDFDELLAPYNAHFVLVPRLIIKGGLEAFGSDYLIFRLLNVAFVVISCALVFEYMGRRVGKLAALAPTLVLLVLGSDFGHVLQGGFTLWLTIACGVGALLALERNDRRGDLLACALLCVGIATYSVALAFVLAAAVALTLAPNPWRRSWVVALPVLIYAAWWLQAQGAAGDPQGQVTYSNLLALPAWAYQSLGTTLGAFSGLDYGFSGAEPQAQAGPVLAMAAIAALVWRLFRGAIPSALWISGAALVGLWSLGALAASSVRPPSADRYVLPVVVTVLLVTAAASAGARWTRPALICLFAAAAIGVGANLLQLRDGGETLRNVSVASIRPQLSAVEIAGERADPDFELPPGMEEENLVEFAFTILKRDNRSAVDSYLTAAERYGPLGYSIPDLQGLPDPVLATVDALLVDIEGISLTPAASSSGECLDLDQSSGQSAFQLEPGNAVTIEASRGTSKVAVRRFADPTATPLGRVEAGSAKELQVPTDEAAEPWVVAVSGPAARVCA